MNTKSEIQFRREVISALSDISGSLKKIADPEIPELNVGEVKIAHCPHCLTINPTITKIDDEEKSGPFGHFFLTARCGSCSSTFWGIPDWTVFEDRQQAVEILKEKAEAYDQNGG